MTRYLLDTNIVSCLVRKHPEVAQRARAVPINSLCISAITEGEMRYGLAKRPEALRLHAAVHELLRCLDVMPWDAKVTAHYGATRAELERQGKTLAPLDLLIAAHAKSLGAILVSNDQAFRQISDLTMEDWTVPA